MPSAGSRRRDQVAWRPDVNKGSLLFYSNWPLGYHNPEAERKAIAFADAGYDVVYVAGIGVRNPRMSRLPKLVDRARRKIRTMWHRRPPSMPGLRTGAVAVLPPRQLSVLHDLNTAWMERQLRSVISDWKTAVAWVRSPTPELTDALASLAPAVVVYECVDAYHLTPGITGRWVEVQHRAERKLVGMSDAVVVPGEVLAERFRGWGADVRVVPHGVDLFPWPGEKRRHSGPRTVGFVGTLDYRLDMKVLTHVARTHPEWRMRLIGPVQEGFDRRAVDRLPNVSIEPPVPHQRLGETLADLDAGLMAYLDTPFYRYMSPLKTLELLAAGCPTVARPSPALEPFAEHLYFATTPHEFVRELERCLAEDTPDRALQRRAVASENTWDRRMEELLAVVEELLMRHGRRG